MTTETLMPLFFLFAITVHNAEEALWLPAWSRNAGRFHKRVSPVEFRFGVLCVTCLAYLVVFVSWTIPTFRFGRLALYGFMGAMIVNAVFPHLIVTIVQRRYSPGLVTALLLLIPTNVVALRFALVSGLLDWKELLIATVCTGGIVLALIPLFFRAGGTLLSFVDESG